MRFILILIAVFIAACGRTPLEPPEIAADRDLVVLTRLGTVTYSIDEKQDPSGFDHDLARLFAEENLHMRVEMLPSQELKGESLDDAGRSVSGLAGKKYAGLIVLAAPEGTIGAHGVSLLEERVVVVNVKALEPQDGDGEKYGRRL